MSKPFVSGALLLLWLVSTAGSLRAQSRAGSPAPEPAKTTTPNLLPVQNYVVIDLGLADSEGLADHGQVALDDVGNAAFGTLINAWGNPMVRTFRNGLISQPINYLPGSANGDLLQSFSFQRLLSSGKLAGTHYYANPNHILLICSCFLGGGGNISDVGIPLPYFGDDNPSGFHLLTGGSSVSVIHQASPDAGSYAFWFQYNGITKPDGSVYRPIDGFQNNYDSAIALASHGVIYVFAADTPAFLTNSATTKYIRQNIKFFWRVSDSGWAIFSDDSWKTFLWDGTKIVTEGWSDSFGDQAADVNSQGWCLLDGPTGGIWHGGTATNFSDFLIETPWERQLQAIKPRLLSNQNAPDQRLYVLTSVTDHGVENERVMWVGSPLPQPAGPENSTSFSWQPYRMQLPEGVTIANLYNEENLRSVNASGVVAAIGNSGRGD